jgi:hypothetical protein
MQPLAQSRPPGGDDVWTATGHERPVFLDEHGRRRRWVLLGGALSGGAAACWLGALVAGAIGFSTLPAVQQGHSSLLAGRTPLVAEREPLRPAGTSAVHRRRSKAARGGRASGLARATELAVSQGPIAATR